MTISQSKGNIEKIKRALSVLFKPGDVVELRALDVRGKTHAGYFNDFDRLANEAPFTDTSTQVPTESRKGGRIT